jgi:hypothetical protein
MKEPTTLHDLIGILFKTFKYRSYSSVLPDRDSYQGLNSALDLDVLVGSTPPEVTLVRDLDWDIAP